MNQQIRSVASRNPVDTSREISQISENLLRWYHQNGRSQLPWRQNGITAYHIWLSEIMLQQTQVSRVIPYFERMVERYPTVQDLAQSNWEEFLPYYQGLGYYSRGRNMLKTAQAVVEQHQGLFPQNLSDLLDLPGVGKYTARAILSFAYHQPTLAFDTNHQRVWGRVMHGSKLAEVDQEEIVDNLPAASIHHLNAAVMDLASLVCTNQNPNCQACPLKSQCLYFIQEGSNEPQKTKKRSTFPKNQAQTVVVLHENHRRYFSTEPGHFQPFTLPAPITSRAQIKEYFLRHYGLNLAVRPPHWIGVWNEVHTQIVNAQVLSGTVTFTAFPDSALKTWLSTQADSLHEWSESA